MKLCQCWDLNCVSLMSETTALPTEPPPLPTRPSLPNRLGSAQYPLLDLHYCGHGSNAYQPVILPWTLPGCNGPQ